MMVCGFVLYTLLRGGFGLGYILSPATSSRCVYWGGNRWAGVDPFLLVGNLLAGLYQLLTATLAGMASAHLCYTASASRRASIAHQALESEELVASTRRTRSRVDELESRVALMERDHAQMGAELHRVLGVLAKHGLDDEGAARQDRWQEEEANGHAKNGDEGGRRRDSVEQQV